MTKKSALNKKSSMADKIDLRQTNALKQITPLITKGELVFLDLSSKFD